MNKNEAIFRGKRTDTGEWVEGYLLQNYDREWYICPQLGKVRGPFKKVEFPFMGNVCLYEVIPETIGRCVSQPGYADYTDQLYFQGDIIKLFSRKHKTPEEYYGVVVDEHCFTENGMGRRFTQDTMQAKVIGNIFDNPKLIGEKYSELYKYYFCIHKENKND